MTAKEPLITRNQDEIVSQVTAAVSVLRVMGYEEPEKRFNEMWDKVKPGELIKENRSMDIAQNERVGKLMEIFKNIADIKGLSTISRGYGHCWHAMYVIKDGDKISEIDIEDMVDSL